MSEPRAGPRPLRVGSGASGKRALKPPSEGLPQSIAASAPRRPPTRKTAIRNSPCRSRASSRPRARIALGHRGRFERRALARSRVGETNRNGTCEARNEIGVSAATTPPRFVSRSAFSMNSLACRNGGFITIDGQPLTVRSQGNHVREPKWPAFGRSTMSEPTHLKSERAWPPRNCPHADAGS